MKTELEIFTPFAKKNKFADRIDGSNCLIYTRVSSKEQEKGFSLETQKRVIEEATETMKLTVLAYFGGTYESAATDERDEFNRMLKFARRSTEKISYIMVYSVDRFSRSGANAIYIASELLKENIRIFAVTQPSDTGTTSGKFHQNIHFIFSEYENDLRREKCTAGIKEMLLNGFWPTKAPLGYDQKTRKKRDNLAMEQRQIITVNETGKLIRKVFYWKAEDKLSNNQILQKLKNAGLNISKQKLTKLLANPFYCGIMTHNILNGQVIEGKHEKLISKELFLAANNMKSRNCTWKHTKDFSEVPLKNFLKCGLCGSSFVGYLVKKKNLWYYKCNKDGCKCNRSAKTLNQLFIEKLSTFTIQDKYIEPVKDEFIKYFHSKVKESESSVITLKVRLKALEAKIEALNERFAVGEITGELYHNYIPKYKGERLEIRSEIDAFTFENSNLEKRIEKYCKILVQPALLWASNGYRGKLELQELIFPSGLTYHRENNDYRTKEINPVITVMTGLLDGYPSFNLGTSSGGVKKSPFVPRRRLELPRLTAYAPQAYLYTIPTPGHYQA